MGLAWSYCGCEATSDWVASWSFTQLGDGHGGCQLVFECWPQCEPGMKEWTQPWDLVGYGR